MSSENNTKYLQAELQFQYIYFTYNNFSAPIHNVASLIFNFHKLNVKKPLGAQ